MLSRECFLSSDLTLGSSELLLSPPSVFPTILHTALLTSADAGIVLRQKPLTTIGNLTSPYRSKLTINREVNDGHRGHMLSVPVRENEFLILPLGVKIIAVSGRSLDAENH
jgi:hypothetical protein